MVAVSGIKVVMRSHDSEGRGEVVTSLIPAFGFGAAAVASAPMLLRAYRQGHAR
jgi:hypothetical protein